MQIIPNAVDSFWLNAKPSFNVIQDNIIRVLSVGKVDKNKNHKTLIQSINSLNSRNSSFKYHLTIIGDFDSHYGRTLKSAHASNTIVFTGKKGKEEIKTYMSQSDIFALASFRETFGIVYAEALSQNLPVIYTREQGFDGWTDNTDIAISVDPQDTVSQQNAIATLGKRRLANNAGSKFVKEKLNWNIVAGRLIATYSQYSSSTPHS